MNHLLASLFIMISIVTFGQNSETKLVLFSGLYESECEFEEDDGQINGKRGREEYKIVKITGLK